tara:strand:- start:443 stop:808 length:366 start_codon:yes stop_codon:yes gene_type:complete
MKKIFIIMILPVVLMSGDSQKIMDEFVYNYFLLAQSKVESSPLVWQDLKEGYLRNYTVRYTDIVLDSMDHKQLSSFYAALRHFNNVEYLRTEIKKGEAYKHIIVNPEKSNYNINYFSSSIE